MPSKSATRSKSKSKSKTTSSRRRATHSRMLSHPAPFAGNAIPVKGWALEFHSATVIPAASPRSPRAASGIAWNRALPFRAATLKGGPKYKTKHNVV